MVWAPKQVTFPHDHRMSAVIGMYGGREDNVYWRRVSNPAKFQIEPAGGEALGAGDTTILGRDIIHSVVNPLEALSGGFWQVTTSKGTVVQDKAVIVAAGVGAFGPNRPPLAGIEAYEGKSVFYYVTHRESFRSKRVVIAGGGDTAVDWALSLAEVAQRVSVIHRRDKFRAAPESEAKLKALVKAGRIDLVVPYQLHALEGAQGQLTAVTVATLDGATRRIEADALLPFFGLSMSLGPIADWELALQHNQIGIDAATTATNRPGIFAIGDVVTYPGKLKLILTGFAEAAIAARSAYALVHPETPLHFEYSTTSGVPSV